MDLQLLPCHRRPERAVDGITRIASLDQVPSITVSRLTSLGLLWRPRHINGRRSDIG